MDNAKEDERAPRKTRSVNASGKKRNLRGKRGGGKMTTGRDFGSVPDFSTMEGKGDGRGSAESLAFRNALQKSWRIRMNAS